MLRLEPLRVWKRNLLTAEVVDKTEFNNKQTNKNLYSHILNLNTVALQISKKKALFEAGKSNRIENNENESTQQYRRRSVKLQIIFYSLR